MQKLKILINAYACSPDMGSEPGMAWNWCIHLAQYCELYIITEGEFKEKIESALVTLPQGKNMHFYYNPLSQKIRNIAWNQGDWRFYPYYKKWQRNTLKIAKDIISKQKIDILHQLNMIGFREPGYLWKIEDIPFIWGPIGGVKKFPVAYLKGAGIKLQIFNRLKNSLNICQLKYDPWVNTAFKRARLLISSIPDSHRGIKKYKKIDSVLIPETSSFITESVPMKRFYDDNFHVMWVAKFDFCKQLPLALRSLAATKNKQIILDIYGKGNETIEKKVRQLAKELNISDQITWHGHKPKAVVQQAMRTSQLFFFTSVSEDTSTVVLEAISNHLPVLCFDACGFGGVIDETVGRKIPLTNLQRSVTDFAEYLNQFYANRSLLENLSLNCKQLQQQLSWDEKAKKVVDLYQKVVSEFETTANDKKDAR